MQYRALYIKTYVLLLLPATYICHKGIAVQHLFIYVTLTCGSTTHTALIVAFPLQQWLRERATMFRYIYITYIVRNS